MSSKLNLKKEKKNNIQSKYKKNNIVILNRNDKYNKFMLAIMDNNNLIENNTN